MFLLSFPSWKILSLQFLVFCFSLLNRAKLLPVEPGGVCRPLVGSLWDYNLAHQNTFTHINHVTSEESACVVVFHSPRTLLLHLHAAYSCSYSTESPPFAFTAWNRPDHERP